MTKKIIRLVLIVALVVSLTGCTKYLQNDKGKYVSNEVTGQRLTENILCQPESEEVIEIYKDNHYDLEKLPKCDQLKVFSGSYEGVWTTVFVKPLAWIIVKIGHLVNNYGLSIIIITLLIRLLLVPITKKTAVQSKNMAKAKPEMEKLEKKYAGKNDQQSNQAKAQEMFAIYKKYDINPFSGCIFAIIQIPLFFAFYEALNRLPAVFEENFLSFQLGTSPLVGLSNGNYQYILIVVLVILATWLSFKLGASAMESTAQQKQMKMMTNIMIIMIATASVSISTGIALYWIINSSFTVIQNLIIRRKKQDAK